MAGIGRPLGRNTARKGGGSRRVRIWDIDSGDNATLKALEVAYLEALGAIDGVEARHAVNKADTRFTPAGAIDDLKTFTLGNAVPQLHRGQVALRKARAELAERKAKLKLPSPDPTDFAAALRRQEARAFIRGKGDQASSYVAKFADKLPPEMAQAIIEMPAEFSGILDEIHQRLASEALAAIHGPDIEKIESLEKAIEATRSAVEGARSEVGLELGITNPAEFNTLAASVEDKLDRSIPWLRGGKVVDLDQRIEREPTAEELANGVEAANLQEYQQRRAAA